MDNLNKRNFKIVYLYKQFVENVARQRKFFFREAPMADEGLKGGGCCGSKPAQATTITIHKAVGVEKQDVVGGKVNQHFILFKGKK